MASWISRRAAHFWVDAATFCVDKGTSLTAVLQNTDQAISALEELGEPVPEEVRQWSPQQFGSGTRSFRGHTFPTKSLQTPVMRGCTHCLREDFETTGAMKMRGHWLVPHISVCVVHETALVPLWREASPLKRFDSAPRLTDLAPDILAGNLDGAPRKLLPFDRWLEARLALTEFPETWLDDLSLHAACNFCHLLGSARLRLEDIPQSRMTPEDRPILYEMGFQVARHGKDEILATFDALQRKPGVPHDGPKAIFPKLYERLAYDYHDHPDYAPFRDLLRTHMLSTWPLGPGDELLGEPVKVRRLHSVRTAAQATGMDQRRLRKTLAAAGIVRDAEHGLPDAWEVFDATSAAPILESMTELITAKDMAASINATRSQFNLLVEDGVLVPDLDAADVKAVWHPAQGQRFLDSILTGAQQLRQAQHGWEHLSKAAQRLKIRPVEIIEAIRDGRITRVGNRMEAEGFAAVHVYHDEVAAVLRPDPVDAQSIEVFAKSVGIGQPSILKRMIDEGHVQTTLLRNPITKVDQAYFTAEDAAVFRERYTTPKLLSQTHGAPWQALVRHLRDAGIKPFSGEHGAFGNVYLRDATDRILG
ncbi:TniQ family protein [Donghicola sp. XS_ASV15]|uniref:TniQ family protein n=1 Tax=Donghicola sp. XS_ASV15 TaxID=3241295 RepID=UPI003518B567